MIKDRILALLPSAWSNDNIYAYIYANILQASLASFSSINSFSSLNPIVSMVIGAGKSWETWPETQEMGSSCNFHK